MRYLLVVLMLGCVAAADPNDARITDIAALVRALPDDAKPKAGEWDEFSEPRANKAFAEAKGKPCVVQAVLERVAITRIAKKDDPNSTEQWRLKFFFQEQNLSFARGTVTKLRIVPADNFVVDEATARASKEWKKGDTVTISGEVSKITLERFIEPALRFTPKKENVTGTISVWVNEPAVVSVGKWQAK